MADAQMMPLVGMHCFPPERKRPLHKGLHLPNLRFPGKDRSVISKANKSLQVLLPCVANPSESSGVHAFKGCCCIRRMGNTMNATIDHASRQIIEHRIVEDQVDHTR